MSTLSTDSGVAQLNSAGALSAEESELVGLVRDIARKVVAPAAMSIDAEAAFPHQVYQAFHDAGFIGLLVPQDHGGLGASITAMTHMYESIASASATVSLLLSNSVEALVPVVAYAHDALRDEVLTRVLGSGEIPCFALTEPSAGSDATAISTRATLTGDTWTITGRKCYITNGSVGNLYLTFAVTDPDARKGRRLSAFIVDRSAEGFSVGVDEATMGLRGSPLSELVFDGVQVPTSRMVGERGQGLEVAMKMLNESRVGAAAQCVGISDAALNMSLAYTAERHAGGRPIIDYQAVQLTLADMAIRTEAARHLTRAAAGAYDTGASFDHTSVLSAMCKAHASDSAVQTSLDAIQLHGGSGVCIEVGVERLLRDAKAFQIFDGTNDIQRLTITKGLTRTRKPTTR